MPYTPLATDTTNPTDTGIKASSAPAEFRALKVYLAGLLAASISFAKIKVGTGVAANISTLLVNNPAANATGIQLAQDTIESWSVGMSASSSLLRIANSGTDRVVVDATGSVGIGTSAPNAKLEIAGGAYIRDKITLQRVAGAAWLDTLQFGDTLSGAKTDNVSVGNAGGGDFLVHTNGAERARFTSIGNVGFATAAFGALNLTGVSIEPYAGGTVTNIGHNGTAANGDSYLNLRRSGVILGSIYQLSSTGIGINSANDLQLSTLGNVRIVVRSSGQVGFTGLSSAPTGSAGDMYYDSTVNKHFGHNGAGWQALY